MASMQDAGFFCIGEEKLPGSKLKVYCGLCLGSAVLGLAGSAWLIHQWKTLLQGYKYRRKPSPNPVIIFSLAVANLLACIAVISRAVTMLSTKRPEPSENNDRLVPLDGRIGLVVLGSVIEACNQYLFTVTFMLTLVYAVDIYVQLAYRDVSQVWYNIIGWLVPGITTLVSVLAITLGGDLPDSCPMGSGLIVRYIFYCTPILVTGLACPVLYLVTDRRVRLRLRESGLISIHSRAIMTSLQHRFLALVVFFILCWLPNLVDGIIHIVMAAVNTPPADAAQFFPIWVLEAVLNPLQGLLMALIYGRQVLSPGRTLKADDKIQESTPILYRSGKYT